MKIVIFSVLIIAIAVIFLSVKVIFKKNGEFPNTHIDGNKEMKKRDIHCVLKEDAIMRRKRK